jgi:hypothetical protein
VFAALAIAVAAAAQKDRISGKWESDGQTLLELKCDGDATVTGTAYFRQRHPFEFVSPDRVECCARTCWLAGSIRHRIHRASQ